MPNSNARAPHETAQFFHHVRMEWDEAEGGYALTIWAPGPNGILETGAVDSPIREPLLTGMISRTDAIRLGKVVKRQVAEARTKRGADYSQIAAREAELAERREYLQKRRDHQSLLRAAHVSDEVLRERSAAIELLAAARGCSVGEAHQLLLGVLDVFEPRES